MKKIFISIITLIIMAISLCQVSYAAEGGESVSLDLESSIDLDKREVIVTLSLGEYKNLSDSAIVACQASVDYDKNIFDSLEIEGVNKWDANYVEETANIIVETKSGVKVTPNQQIAKFTFKLKDNVEEADTKITLKNIKMTVDAEKNFTDFGELTANIKINKKIEEDNKEPTEENNNENPNAASNENENKNEEEKEKNNTTTNITTQPSSNTTINNIKLINQANNDTTTTTKTLPKTGILKIATILAVIAIIGIACLIRYKSIEIK